MKSSPLTGGGQRYIANCNRVLKSTRDSTDWGEVLKGFGGNTTEPINNVREITTYIPLDSKLGGKGG